MLLGGGMLFAQTPEEIVDKMCAEMDRSDTEGCTLDFKMKIPIVGLVVSQNTILGNKTKTIMSARDIVSTIWTDGTTKWTYEEKDNEIIIEAVDPSKSKDEDFDTKAFNSISDGYDLTLKSETPEAWNILCKKSRSNKDKDDPNRMNLTVSKATYLPICLEMKKAIFTITIENFSLGASEESVTFNPAQYPNAKIIDKRVLE